MNIQSNLNIKYNIHVHTSKTVISAQSIVQRQLNNPWNIFRQVIFDVRVPFRCYPNILNLERTYSPFCFIYVSIGGGNVTSSKITDVVWSGVSFATYICPRSFIFFMNRRLNITRPTLFVDFFIVLAHWDNSQLVEMLLHSDTLSWFPANQSLILLLNDMTTPLIPYLPPGTSWRSLGIGTGNQHHAILRRWIYIL
jgi:hypothetical protein